MRGEIKVPLYRDLDDLEDAAINFEDAANLAVSYLIDIKEDALIKEIRTCQAKLMKLAKQKYISA
jgi:hypothetical protein